VIKNQNKTNKKQTNKVTKKNPAWYLYRQVDQWNRIEDPEMSLDI